MWKRLEESGHVPYKHMVKNSNDGNDLRLRVSRKFAIRISRDFSYIVIYTICTIQRLYYRLLLLVHVYRESVQVFARPRELYSINHAELWPRDNKDSSSTLNH